MIPLLPLARPDLNKVLTGFRFVTLRIYYLPDVIHWPLRFAVNDLEHFGILLRSIDRLCGVSISVSFPRHRDCISFNKALRKTGSWSSDPTKLCSLTFLDDPVDLNFNAVFRRFWPKSLGAVQLPGGFNRKHYVKLEKSLHATYL